MDYQNLIPKNKFDFSSFPKLMEFSENEIIPILPELILWIADMNWPIADEMVNILIRHPDALTPVIKKKLQPTETDVELKYFIITDLIPKLPANFQKLLLMDIERIIDNPTNDEKTDVLGAAKDYAVAFGRNANA